MTRANLNTHLKKRKRAADPMREFDALPKPLREWLASAALPWSARSARAQWRKAMKQSGGCETRAKEYLARVEFNHLSKDAKSIWGADHPLLTSREATR